MRRGTPAGAGRLVRPMSIDRVCAASRSAPTAARCCPGAATTRSTPSSRPLVNAYLERHRRADTTLIEHAFDVARDAHAEQVRRSGEPYITHPLGVAMILADLGLDDVTIAAALLHDAVEDTTVTLGRHRARVRRRRRRASSTASPSSTASSSTPRRRSRPPRCARCSWRWPRTSASCSSSSPTGSTTCARSRRCPSSSSGASRRRRSTSTRRSRTGSASPT